MFPIIYAKQKFLLRFMSLRETELQVTISGIYSYAKKDAWKPLNEFEMRFWSTQCGPDINSYGSSNVNSTTGSTCSSNSVRTIDNFVAIVVHER